MAPRKRFLTTVSRIVLTAFVILAMTSLLGSCASTPVSTLTDGNTLYEVFRNNTNIKIQVSINGTATGTYTAAQVTASDLKLELVDMNFDGVKDMRIQKNNSGNYLCWLSKNGRYSLSHDLNELFYPEFDAEKKQVVCRIHSITDDNAGMDNAPSTKTTVSSFATYSWNNDGDLIINEYRALTYYSAQDIYCYTLGKPDEAGNYDETDKWIYPEDIGEYEFDSWLAQSVQNAEND